MRPERRETENCRRAAASTAIGATPGGIDATAGSGEVVGVGQEVHEVGAARVTKLFEIGGWFFVGGADLRRFVSGR